MIAAGSASEPRLRDADPAAVRIARARLREMSEAIGEAIRVRCRLEQRSPVGTLNAAAGLVLAADLRERGHTAHEALQSAAQAIAEELIP